jgi:hypothetical protein
MSLANYKSLCIEKYKLANPDKDIPKNMGSKWTEIEERELLENIRNHLDIEEIAKKHSRTRGAITARLEVIAVRMYEDDKYDAEYIEEVTRMNIRSIQEAIDKKDKYKSKYDTKHKYPHQNTDTEIANLKKEVMELKAMLKDLKRDDIDELKKQIQNILDIQNIKNDIIELKNAIRVPPHTQYSPQ